jgi:hypothetical protein
MLEGEAKASSPMALFAPAAFFSRRAGRPLAGVKRSVDACHSRNRPNAQMELGKPNTPLILWWGIAPISQHAPVM